VARVAALYDVHGNAPALDAVLADVARGGFDLIVCGGDVVSGPMPAAVLDALTAQPLPVRWVDGNGDREVREGAVPWVAQRLGDGHLALLATFAPTVEADGVLFCHATPRSDSELVTAITPDDDVAAAIGRSGTVVCGHVHAQFDRTIGPLRLVNAGSVGMPYEGRPGAFWLELADGVPRHRRSDYDVDAAAAAIRASGYPEADELVAESLRGGVGPAEVAAFFESRR
jgi:diadenosine tetraphosphatase ApaH/serine/threonine PP2A family protein phosphatase